MYTIRRYWRIIFPIFFIILIWIFSSANGDASNSFSMKVAAWLGVSNTLARKLAHFVLFGCLGYSLSSFVKGLHPATFPTHTQVTYPVILCVIYGAIDEVHQLTVFGRSAQIGDVFIDSIGGICGVLLYIAIFCFYRRWRIRRQIEKITH